MEVGGIRLAAGAAGKHQEIAPCFLGATRVLLFWRGRVDGN